MRVDELKNKILQLAIQGKLVPQDPNDEPASVLLEKIKEEKEQLIKEKKIKKEKPLPEISEEEKAFEIPEGWEWCRLQDISKIISKGTTPKGGKSAYTEKGVNFLRVENMTYDYNIDLTDIRFINEKTHMQELKRSIAEEYDLLISIAGTLGRVAIIRREQLPCNMNQAISFIRIFYNYINIEFLKYILDSPIIKKLMINKTKTTAQPNLTLEIISNLIIPLPPLQEQKRIVAKIDELFSIIDKLGENKEALSKNIDITRDKVLQLAIQGKLVPQDPNDEPASVLLEKIKKEKEQLIKEKKIKKEKPLPEISEEEKGFEIPEGWEWCRLGNIFNIKSSKRVYEKDYVEIGVPFYRSKEIGVLSENKEVNTNYYISYELYNELKYKYGTPKQGDLLVTSVGTIGKCWISDGREFYYKDGNITQIENTSLIDMKYLKNFIYSICFSKQIGKTVTGTAYNALTIIKFKNILMPLPPLQEQKRIVAKIDEIMGYLDKLQHLIDGKSLGIEGVQAKEIALSKAEELVQK